MILKNFYSRSLTTFLGTSPPLSIFVSRYNHLDCFNSLAVVNNAMNIEVHISFLNHGFLFVLRGFFLGGGIFILEWKLFHIVVFFFGVFFRNLGVFFYSGCTDLHSHQQCMSFPFSEHPCQHLLFLIFLMMAILTDVR